MNINFWLDNTEFTRCLSILGYSTITVLKAFKHFGYKNGKEIKEELNVADSLLSFKLAYKNELELRDIYERLSLVIKYLKYRQENNKSCGVISRPETNFVLRVSSDERGEFEFSNNNSCMKYAAGRVLSREIKRNINKKFDLNIYIGE